LLSFEEARGTLSQWSQAYGGMRSDEVEKLTGSVGSYRDFEGSFLPLRVSMAHRWGSTDRAYHRGVESPAVSLYKIGDAYFVRDGNHVPLKLISISHGVWEVFSSRAFRVWLWYQLWPRVVEGPDKERGPTTFYLQNSTFQ
jgi:hypothetical protein